MPTINALIYTAIRLPLRAIPTGAVVPILQGRLRGKRWIVGSHIHGCWLGTYELTKRRTFERVVTSGMTVYDIGANVGFYSLLAAVLVGDNGKVYAFEPVPRNLSYLHRHLELNAIHTVSVIPAAVSDRDGEVRFWEAHDAAQGRIADQGQLTVRSVSLDGLLKDTAVTPPDCIKIDVEGAELHVLHGAEHTLCDYHPLLFLATHTPELRHACRQLLGELGYTLHPLDAQTLADADEVFAAPRGREGADSRAASTP